MGGAPAARGEHAGDAAGAAVRGDRGCLLGGGAAGDGAARLGGAAHPRGPADHDGVSGRPAAPGARHADGGSATGRDRRRAMRGCV
ncbi:hypothetical protein SGPA1_11068 [Streptomyces misionensis JCM 4497]